MINQFKPCFTLSNFSSILLIMIALSSVTELITFISILCIHCLDSLLSLFLISYFDITPLSPSVKSVVVNNSSDKKPTLSIDILGNDLNVSERRPAEKPLQDDVKGDNKTITNKRPSLSIDTSIRKDKDIESSTMTITTPMMLNSLPPKPVSKRKRHYSISTMTSNASCKTHDADVFPYPENVPSTPLLSYSPTSSVSSVSSISWNPDDSKRSQVEEMVYMFETGEFQRGKPQHRRYSVDSYNLQQQKKTFIRERKFEYQPIVGEWKKRVITNNCPVSPMKSKSTPIQFKRRITPIPEHSKSLVA